MYIKYHLDKIRSISMLHSVNTRLIVWQRKKFFRYNINNNNNNKLTSAPTYA